MRVQTVRSKSQYALLVVFRLLSRPCCSQCTKECLYSCNPCLRAPIVRLGSPESPTFYDFLELSCEISDFFSVFAAVSLRKSYSTDPVLPVIMNRVCPSRNSPLKVTVCVVLLAGSGTLQGQKVPFLFSLPAVLPSKGASIETDTPGAFLPTTCERLSTVGHKVCLKTSRNFCIFPAQIFLLPMKCALFPCRMLYMYVSSPRKSEHAVEVTENFAFHTNCATFHQGLCQADIQQFTCTHLLSRPSKQNALCVEGQFPSVQALPSIVCFL